GGRRHRGGPPRTRRARRRRPRARRPHARWRVRGRLVRAAGRRGPRSLRPGRRGRGRGGRGRLRHAPRHRRADAARGQRPAGRQPVRRQASRRPDGARQPFDAGIVLVPEHRLQHHDRLARAAGPAARLGVAADRAPHRRRPHPAAGGEDAVRAAAAGRDVGRQRPEGRARTPAGRAAGAARARRADAGRRRRREGGDPQDRRRPRGRRDGGARGHDRSRRGAAHRRPHPRLPRRTRRPGAAAHGEPGRAARGGRWRRGRARQAGGGPMTVTDARAPEEVSLRRILPPVVTGQEVVLLAVLAVLWVLLGIFTPAFLTAGSIGPLLVQVAPIALIGVGMTFVIITAGIDVSVAGMIMVCAVVTARTLVGADVPAVVAVALAVALGAVLGSVNGLLIAYGRVHPIIITFGTANVFTWL